KALRACVDDHGDGHAVRMDVPSHHATMATASTAAAFTPFRNHLALVKQEMRYAVTARPGDTLAKGIVPITRKHARAFPDLDQPPVGAVLQHAARHIDGQAAGITMDGLMAGLACMM